MTQYRHAYKRYAISLISSPPFKIFYLARINISQASFLMGVSADTCKDLMKGKKDWLDRSIKKRSDVLVSNFEAFPKRCKLLVKSEIKTEFVLHFDAFLYRQLF